MLPPAQDAEQLTGSNNTMPTSLVFTVQEQLVGKLTVSGDRLAQAHLSPTPTLFRLAQEQLSTPSLLLLHVQLRPALRPPPAQIPSQLRPEPLPLACGVHAMLQARSLGMPGLVLLAQEQLEGAAASLLLVQAHDMPRLKTVLLVHEVFWPEVTF